MRSSILSDAYAMKFKIDASSPGYTIKEDGRFLAYQNKRLEFMNSIQNNELNNSIEPNAILSLSPQQYNCLKLLAEGNSAKRIAKILGLSPRTVEKPVFPHPQTAQLFQQ